MLKEDAKGDFGIRFSDWLEAPPFIGMMALDIFKSAVMCKGVHTAAEFAHKRLSVGKGQAACCRVPDVRKHAAGGEASLINERNPFALGGWFWFLIETDIAIVVKGKAPTIDRAV
jgi:hypothetical protein